MGQDEESQVEIYLGNSEEEALENVQLFESEGLLDHIVCLTMEDNAS